MSHFGETYSVTVIVNVFDRTPPIFSCTSYVPGCTFPFIDTPNGNALPVPTFPLVSSVIPSGAPSSDVWLSLETPSALTLKLAVLLYPGVDGPTCCTVALAGDTATLVGITPSGCVTPDVIYVITGNSCVRTSSDLLGLLL